MKRLWLCLAVMLCGNFAYADPLTRFVSVEIYLDSPQPLAAWQFEFASQGSTVQIVGVENGESAVFHEAPYYDRNATAAGAVERVVVADYSLAKVSELPSGRMRLTTLHLMVSSQEMPQFETNLIVATTTDGRKINAVLSLNVEEGS